MSCKGFLYDRVICVFTHDFEMTHRLFDRPLVSLVTMSQRELRRVSTSHASTTK